MAVISGRRRSVKPTERPCTGPTSSRCRARRNSAAVIRMPSSATAVTAAVPILPVKIWNSAMKPEKPGMPSEANAATAISPASRGAGSASPP